MILVYTIPFLDFKQSNNSSPWLSTRKEENTVTQTEALHQGITLSGIILVYLISPPDLFPPQGGQDTEPFVSVVQSKDLCKWSME